METHTLAGNGVESLVQTFLGGERQGNEKAGAALPDFLAGHVAVGEDMFQHLLCLDKRQQAFEIYTETAVVAAAGHHGSGMAVVVGNGADDAVWPLGAAVFIDGNTVVPAEQIDQGAAAAITAGEEFGFALCQRIEQGGGLVYPIALEGEFGKLLLVEAAAAVADSVKGNGRGEGDVFQHGVFGARGRLLAVSAIKTPAVPGRQPYFFNICGSGNPFLFNEAQPAGNKTRLPCLSPLTRREK